MPIGEMAMSAMVACKGQGTHPADADVNYVDAHSGRLWLVELLFCGVELEKANAMI